MFVHIIKVKLNKNARTLTRGNEYFVFPVVLDSGVISMDTVIDIIDETIGVHNIENGDFKIVKSIEYNWKIPKPGDILKVVHNTYYVNNSESFFTVKEIKDNKFFTVEETSCEFNLDTLYYYYYLGSSDDLWLTVLGSPGKEDEEQVEEYIKKRDRTRLIRDVEKIIKYNDKVLNNLSSEELETISRILIKPA